MSSNQSLPEKHGQDVSDWLGAGHTVDELLVIVEAKPPWSPSEGPESMVSLSKFNFTPLDDLYDEPEEQLSFVLDKTLPVGGFSICSAKPKVGKSTTARNLAVRVSRGEPFLGRNSMQGKVLYMGLEEKRPEIRKHFVAMNASGKDVLVYTGKTPDNPIEEIELAIAEHDPVLVIIDPLSRVLRVWDFNDYATMSRGLEPFIDLARRTGVHILALHHDGKGERDGATRCWGQPHSSVRLIVTFK